MKVVQVKLKSKTGNSEMTTWVDQPHKIKQGVFITFRERKDFWWEVVEVFSIADSENLHTDWNVGGL